MKVIRALFAAGAVFWIGACEKADTRKEAVDSGDRKVKAGAYREAIKSYEAALDGTPNTATIHYRIAVLYDEKLKEHLDAIHHYERYLDYSPSGQHAKEAKSAKADCEKRLQAKLNKEGFMPTSEAVRLRNENESLRRLISDLRNPKAPPPPRVADPNTPDAIPPGSREYTVGPGDTLASIANKFYKNRSMSDHIKDANFHQLGGKDVIKPGQVLIIPEAPKRKNQ